jgi:hypothetical protein
MVWRSAGPSLMGRVMISFSILTGRASEIQTPNFGAAIPVASQLRPRNSCNLFLELCPYPAGVGDQFDLRWVAFGARITLGGLTAFGT